MSQERPAGPVALNADELEEFAELERAERLEGDRDTPLPPTNPDPLPPTDAPPPLELEPQAVAADPAGAIMISAPQRPAAPGFWPVAVPSPPVQGAASG